MSYKMSCFLKWWGHVCKMHILSKWSININKSSSVVEFLQGLHLNEHSLLLNSFCTILLVIYIADCSSELLWQKCSDMSWTLSEKDKTIKILTGRNKHKHYAANVINVKTLLGLLLCFSIKWSSIFNLFIIRLFEASMFELF